MTITKSNEDYLEAILMMEGEKGTKSIAVANMLKVTKAAVSFAMEELIEKGLIKKETYGNIFLTTEGREIAQRTLDTHKMLVKLLEYIGVDSEIASEDACKIEHVLNNQTVDCLKTVLTKISNN